MLPLLTRRVALSVYRPTATYTHILLSSVSTLRSRRILYDSLRTGGIQPFANPQRNASTEVTATLNKAKPSTTERKKLGEHLTPEQEKSAKELLQAKKAREKEKEELEKKKKELRKEKLAHATAALKAKFKAQEQKEREKQKAREAKKQMIIKPPPRVINAFPLFLQDTKKSLTEGYSDWQSLPEEKKQEYVARAEALRTKRREEFEAFVRSVTPTDIRRYNNRQRSRGGRTIRLKSTNRPLGPFIRFALEFRAQPDQAGKRVIEVSKVAGEAWRSMTQAEKDKYKVVPSESTAA